MRKKLYSLLAVFAVASLLLVACGTGGGTGAGFKACQVTDTGGIDDRSFNATAYKGITDAVDQLGIEGAYLESQQQTDYEVNINAFLEEECDLIVTVGFLLGEATGAAATANPDQNFAIVDFAYDPAFENVKGLVFTTDQAAFLAGYVAAATTTTGIVATYGGIDIGPPVTDFMDGFAYGVAYYNEQKGTNVEVLGWDPATRVGDFAGTFEDTLKGRELGEGFLDDGADIIMPVAGPVGLGTAAAVQERGGAYIIGVDTDWTQSASEYAAIILTSVLKNMDVAVFTVIQEALAGTFAGGLYIGTLENGGVGIAAGDMISPELQAELDEITAGIIAGDIQTKP